MSLSKEDLREIASAVNHSTPISDVIYKIMGGLMLTSIIYVASTIPNIKLQLAVMATQNENRVQNEARYLSFMEKKRFSQETFDYQMLPHIQKTDYNSARLDKRVETVNDVILLKQKVSDIEDFIDEHLAEERSNSRND